MTSALSGTTRQATIPAAIIDLLPVAAYVCDVDGNILRFNDAATNLWGRRPRPGEHQERFCDAFRLFRADGSGLAPRDTPMARVLRDGAPLRNVEMWIERPSGRRVFSLVNIDPVRDARGELSGAIVCFQDITARKEAEDALRRHRTMLRAQERHFRSMLEALPLALYTTDAEGRITFFNEAAVRLWGVRPALGSRDWSGSWRLCWPDGREMGQDETPLAVSLREGRRVTGTEAVIERPDGRRVPCTPYPMLLRNSFGEVIGAVNVLVDITHRKQAEERLHLLINELNHRVKNALATVQSIAALTMREGDCNTHYELFEARLGALSRAHELLARHNWAGATLGSLLSQELAPYREAGRPRFTVRGDEVPLDASAALALAMIFHELATNAAKYGALSNSTGVVEVSWETQMREGEKWLRMDWMERGGPPVRPPARRGFGSRLIERNVTGQLGGRLDYQHRTEGVRCRLELPLRAEAPAVL